MLTLDQLAWLKSKLNFDSLADMLESAKSVFPEADIVPTLVICGRTGAGKSTLINTLVGRYVQPVGVLPTTQEPTARELENEGIPLRVLDMPGVGEAGRHGERLSTVLDQAEYAHLLLLCVPCPERSLAYEADLLKEVQTYYTGREPLPVLVAATKIDCAAPVRDWNPEHLNLAHPSTEKELNITAWLSYLSTLIAEKSVGMVPCSCGEAFDDRAHQYGITALRKHIFEILPEAARSFFVRLTRDMELIDLRAEHIVRTMSAMSSAAAAQPVPSIPDAALIMPIQIAMLARLTKLHGRELSADLAAKLLGPLAARVAGRFAFEQLSKFLPGVGSLVGAAVAGSMTYALGMAYHTLLYDGHWNFDAETLKDEVLRWWKNAHRQ